MRILDRRSPLATAEAVAVGTILLALPLLASSVVPSIALAASFTVDSTGDDGDDVPGDGSCATASSACTLRAAVDETNALAGADQIALPAGVYVRAVPRPDNEIFVWDDLEIDGAGAASTILDANRLGRMLSIVGQSAVTIRGVTVRNGDSRPGSMNLDGGGIRNNDSALTLVDSVVTQNFAADGGGIVNEGGTLVVERCTISENTALTTGGGGLMGGGIASWSGSPVTIVDSTISGNRARLAGGILSGGATTIVNSTISGNTATDQGGGIFAGLGTTELANVTVTGNSAGSFGGGGIATNGIIPGLIRVKNTVVAGNTASAGKGPDCRATLTSQGYNLIESTANCAIAGDLTGVVTGVSAGLGPLQDNGGPTRTHAPLPGSAAIDAGNPALPGSGGNACAAGDQRAVTRPIGTACDIGAVEASCGDGVVQAFEECDDGNGTDGDGCDSSCTLTGCGNGVVTSGEQCDDGNTAGGDCCSAACQLEVAGSACSDGNLCSTEQCDGAGRCVETFTDCAAIDSCHYDGTCDPGTGACSTPEKPDDEYCDDGDPCTAGDRCQAAVCISGLLCGGDLCYACSPGVGCSPEIATGCRQAGRSSLALDSSLVGPKSGLKWLWKSGAPTVKADYGQPTAGTDYGLCVFDETGGPLRLRTSIRMPGGSTCKGRPCWREVGSGFAFLSHPYPRSSTRAKLRATPEGKGTISVTANNSAVVEFPPSLTPDLTVQVKSGDGACWEASYTSAMIIDDRMTAKTE